MVTIENHIGKISVSENYLTQIVKNTVIDCFGVTDVCTTTTFQTAAAALTRGLAFKKQKGVVIRTDKNNKLNIDLHIKVTYGTNISATVDSIVHKVTFVVEDTTGVDVENVNVFVDDITL